MKIKNKFIISVVFLLSTIFSCSDFQIISDDGNIVYGRTFDFPIISNPEIRLTKKGNSLSSISPSGKKTFNSIADFSFCTIVNFGNDKLVAQGINEAGLTASVLWHPAGTKYIDPERIASSPYALEVTDVLPMILGKISNIDELINLLETAEVWAKAYPELKNTSPTAHFIVYDSSGRGVAVEYENGKLKISENNFGVFTNSPNFKWHLTNMRNYIGLTNVDKESALINNIEFKKIGVGGGLLGMPGDQTSPSRFIRLFTIKRFMNNPTNLKEALACASHLVGNVFSLNGEVITKNNEVDFTQWALITDQKNLDYYIKLYDNMNWSKISLKEIFKNKKNGYKISFKKISES